ncbi:MAG: S8 family serine peptidase [Clostridia bacterium]|nr:S8 family serine peptidase [Clostridia bacterium]
MKLRNFANKFLLIICLVVVCWGYAFVGSVPTALTLTPQATATKTYLLDQYNHNEQTGATLYEDLGIKTYNDYLQTLQATQGLRDVVIAVIDSGLDDSHAVFQDRILTEYAVNFSEGLDKTVFNQWNEDHNGHGTHVAGVLADATLSNVKILPIKIFYGENNNGDDYAFENAVRYLCALKTGKKVTLLNSSGFGTYTYEPEGEPLNIVAVNLSLGTSGYNTESGYDMQEYTALKANFQKVIDYLLNCEMLPIVAAGNIDSDKNESQANTYYSLPGACDGVLAVSAYDNTYDEYALASFSYHNDQISLTAPGVQIWSACSLEHADIIKKALGMSILIEGKIYETGQSAIRYVDGNYYLRISGTSMATPFVTACYALLMSDPSKVTADDFGLESLETEYMTLAHKALLAAAATYGDPESYGYTQEFGYGMVTVQGFATETVVPLNAIVYKPTASTTYQQVSFDAPSGQNAETDWVNVCSVLLIGGILIWGFNLFRSYFSSRRQANDNQSEQSSE